MDDLYIKESCKSYQKCLVANSARRNSLTKKTIGIEVERKLASHLMDREERQLREHLKQMKFEKAKTSALNGIRDKTENEPRQRKSQVAPQNESHENEFVDPYPITFASVVGAMAAHRQRANTMEDKGRKYAARRGRRESKEFEDLCLNTSTGKLAIPGHLWLHPLMSLTPSGTPPPSSPQRKISSSSRSSHDSMEMLYWPGDPEAIHSVRRPRKSVEQQDKERVRRMIGDLSNV